jgi:hypothetical protein
MDWIKLVEVFWGWPLVILILAIVFKGNVKDSISVLVARLKGKGKIGGFEIELGGPILSSLDRPRGSVKSIRREVFENKAVVIDGKSFYKCKFKNVNFIYNGSGDFGFNQCDMEDFEFEFSESAGMTLAALSKIYSGFGVFGQHLIEQTFENIRKKS